MQHLGRIAVLVAAILAVCAPSAFSQENGPPMGWNSWDAYGFTIDEAQYKANATVLATLKPLGWTYAVIDEGWYMDNPFGDKLASRDYQLDRNGLLIPSPKRFPSAADGKGFKPLADWTHANGLKFGIHIVRGIPKQAVALNMPIAGTDFHAGDAADTSDLCGWDDGGYGVRDNAAGQAYYDSMIRLYAEWGVDFLKVDCIADHPYKGSEIRQIASAIKKSGRPIVLSLSPGPTQLAKAGEVARYAQMWRIADDIWDRWDFKPKRWPNGLVTAFDNLASWNPHVTWGSWPDADMLPFGALMPHPGWGQPRSSELTPDEERTQFTLWAISRSPLVLGANLTLLDAFTRSLITSKDVIAVNQTAWNSHPIADLPRGWDNVRVWAASMDARAEPTHAIAIFNLNSNPIPLAAKWAELGFAGSYAMRDLWTNARSGPSDSISITLPPHGSAIFRLEGPENGR